MSAYWKRSRGANSRIYENGVTVFRAWAAFNVQKLCTYQILVILVCAPIREHVLLYIVSHIALCFVISSLIPQVDVIKILDSER